MTKYRGNLNVVESPFDGDSLTEAVSKMEKFLGREGELVTYQLTPSIWAVFQDQATLDLFSSGRNSDCMPIGGVVASEVEIVAPKADK